LFVPTFWGYRAYRTIRSQIATLGEYLGENKKILRKRLFFPESSRAKETRSAGNATLRPEGRLTTKGGKISLTDFLGEHGVLDQELSLRYVDCYGDPREAKREGGHWPCARNRRTWVSGAPGEC